MDSKRLKYIDVIVFAQDDNYDVRAVKHCSSPLYVNVAKAILVECLSHSFPGLTFHVNVVRVYG